MHPHRCIYRDKPAPYRLAFPLFLFRFQTLRASAIKALRQAVSEAPKTYARRAVSAGARAILFPFHKIKDRVFIQIPKLKLSVHDAQPEHIRDLAVRLAFLRDSRGDIVIKMRFVGVVINTVLVLFADSPELDVELERYTAVSQSLAEQGVQNVVQLEIKELDRVVKNLAAQTQIMFYLRAPS